MTARETPVSRRAFLVAAAGTAAACTGRPRHRAADPDAALLAQARETERRLLAASVPGTAGYDEHVAHLRALGGALPSSPPTAPNPANASAAATAERASVPMLQAAAVAARSGPNAATLASIAAAHAVSSAGPSPAATGR